jgi:hypothetical protein
MIGGFHVVGIRLGGRGCDNMNNGKLLFGRCDHQMIQVHGYHRIVGFFRSRFTVMMAQQIFDFFVIFG